MFPILCGACRVQQNAGPLWCRRLMQTGRKAQITTLCYASEQRQWKHEKVQFRYQKRSLTSSLLMPGKSRTLFAQPKLRTPIECAPAVTRLVWSVPSAVQKYHPHTAASGTAQGSSVRGQPGVVLFHRQTSTGTPQTQKSFILSPKGIVQASPEFLRPYLELIRFDRPIGTWLLFLPCAFSISLAATPGCLPDATMLGLFGLGSFLMRGAGCTINDMLDRDLDAKVERTKDRPLVSGRISNFNALLFLGLQLSGSLAILLSFNWNTVFLGAFAMVPVVIYPLMKRITYWPQAFLGLTFNYGILMGWCAVQGGLDWGVLLPLYSSTIAWTLVYDTIYGHQDKKDDVLVGVKSTALRFGDNTKSWLLGFGGVMVSGLTATGILLEQTWPYFTGVGIVASHILYQISTVNLDDPEDCGKKFRSNRNLGLILWLCIIAGNLLKPEADRKQEEIVSD